MSASETSTGNFNYMRFNVGSTVEMQRYDRLQKFRVPRKSTVKYKKIIKPKPAKYIYIKAIVIVCYQIVVVILLHLIVDLGN